MEVLNKEDGIDFNISGSNGVLSFTAPKKRNPLSKAILANIGNLVSTYDGKIDVLIFTGTDDVFAAGANISELAGLNPETADTFSRLGQETFSAIRSFQGQTIAAINGHCMGGALDLALSCDIRIAHPGALFAHPGASLGLITGWGGTRFLPESVGRQNALELFLTAKRISAEKALEIGLVDRISDTPLEEAEKYVGSK